MKKVILQSTHTNSERHKRALDALKGAKKKSKNTLTPAERAKELKKWRDGWFK